jgi:hypothetical protein
MHLQNNNLTLEPISKTKLLLSLRAAVPAGLPAAGGQAGFLAKQSKT